MNGLTFKNTILVLTVFFLSQTFANTTVKSAGCMMCHQAENVQYHQPVMQKNKHIKR